MPSIRDTISKLSDFVGQNFDDVSGDVERTIDLDGHPWRWLEPDTQVHPADVRGDRITVHVNTGHTILGYTVG